MRQRLRMSGKRKDERERVSKMKVFSSSAFSFIVREYNAKIACIITYLSVPLITVHL